MARQPGEKDFPAGCQKLVHDDLCMSIRAIVANCQAPAVQPGNPRVVFKKALGSRIWVITGEVLKLTPLCLWRDSRDVA
jgi:hypothetical protein